MRKIKIEKRDYVAYDAENGLLTNKGWAIKIFGDVTTSDGVINGAMLAGKSFVRPSFSASIEFDYQVPRIKAVTDSFKKESSHIVAATGTAHFGKFQTGRDRKYRLEYKGEGTDSIWITEGYADILEMWNGCPIYGTDERSPLYVVEEDGTVLAVVMPMKD